MLKIDLDTQPGGVRAHWRKKGGDCYLSLHRRDGSLIMRIHAPTADERALSTAAHALNFMLRSHNDTNTGTKAPSGADTRDPMGDGAQT